MNILLRMLTRVGAAFNPLDLLDEINLARRDPKLYATYVSERSRNFNNQYEVAETIRYLQTVTPCNNILTLNSELSNLSTSFLAEQGAKGELGHGSFSIRFNNTRYLEIAENISYGITSARDIVVAFIVDEGIPGKGHRLNIFNCRMTEIGIGYSYHSQYRIAVGIIFRRIS